MDRKAGMGGAAVFGAAVGAAAAPPVAGGTGSGIRRHISVMAEDTESSAAACQWFLENSYKEGEDVLHLTYVVRCLQPSMEVFHGAPGCSYSFTPPAEMHKEHQMLADAKARLEARFLPLLRPRLVPYQLHLYAEREDASLQQVADLLLQDVELRNAALVVMAAHNKPGTDEELGSIAESVSSNCHRPLAIVRPPSEEVEG